MNEKKTPTPEQEKVLDALETAPEPVLIEATMLLYRGGDPAQVAKMVPEKK